jgi:hypothetical protein
MQKLKNRILTKEIKLSVSVIPTTVSGKKQFYM